MSSGEKSHVRLTYKRNASDITWIYRVDEEILRSAQTWLALQNTVPTAEILADWFHKNGAALNCATGPSYISRDADGSIEERYCRDGLEHRDDGPAYSWRRSNGATSEEYRRMGKLHRDDGPAVTVRHANGSIIEE